MRWPVSTCSWVCAISTISLASCSSRPAARRSAASSATALAARAAPARCRRAARGNGWPPSTLSTTTLSGQGASARKADFDERQRDDGQRRAPGRGAGTTASSGKRHPLGPQVTLRCAGRRGDAAKSSWPGRRQRDGGHAARAGVLDVEPCRNDEAKAATASRSAADRRSVEMTPSGSITRMRPLSESAM